jgi:hypothetical protein
MIPALQKRPSLLHLLRRAGVAFCTLVAPGVLHAAPPALDHLYPAGGAIDSTNTVTITGKFEPWPPKVWVSSPGLEFNAQTNKGKFEVTMAPDAAPGPRWIRLFNEEGASEPRLFVVGEWREIRDQEPNDHFAKAQPIESLPVTVNGQLDKRGDVDSFAVPLRAGQWLEARLDAYTLMSKLDAVLRIVNQNGRQLAWNHDFITLDPRLVWQATEEGTFIVQVFGFPYPADAQVRLAGGEGCVYRLHLSVSDSRPADDVAPPDAAPPELDESSEVLPLPARVPGLFLTGAEVHEVKFRAQKDEVLEAKVEAAIHGSPLDAWLGIYDEAGKELARNDDAGGSRDPRIEWKAPAEGVYLARVGSVTHRGGPAHTYTLLLQPLAPGYQARLAASSVVLQAGATQEVKVAVTRLRGFTNELLLHWEGLPEGVIGTPVAVPEKGGDVTLPLVASEDAAPHSGAISIRIQNGDQASGAVAFELISSTVDNGVPGGYQKLLKERLDEFWVTVRARPPAPTAEGQ